MRVFRSLGLLALGAFAGFAGAAALMKKALPSRGDEESDEVALVAIFDGIDLKSRASAFRGGSMLAWFGGIDVDLSEAQLTPGARLSVTTLYGGIAIRIPEGWRVESSVKALAGGVDVRAVDAEDPDAPTLMLEGLAAFGGVAIGAKRRSPKPESGDD